eukprot:gene3752-7449_t
MGSGASKKESYPSKVESTALKNVLAGPSDTTSQPKATLTKKFTEQFEIKKNTTTPQDSQQEWITNGSQIKKNHLYPNGYESPDAKSIEITPKNDMHRKSSKYEQQSLSKTETSTLQVVDTHSNLLPKTNSKAELTESMSSVRETTPTNKNIELSLDIISNNHNLINIETFPIIDSTKQIIPLTPKCSFVSTISNHNIIEIEDEPPTATSTYKVIERVQSLHMLDTSTITHKLDFKIRRISSLHNLNEIKNKNISSFNKMYTNKQEIFPNKSNTLITTIPVTATESESIELIKNLVMSLNECMSSLSDTSFIIQILDIIPKIINKDKFKHHIFGSTDDVATNIVIILRYHIESTLICCKALHTIQMLCRLHSNRSTSNDENIQKFGSAGACEAVIAVIKAHSSSTSIIEEACCAIRYLSVNLDNKIRFGSEQVCSLLFDILSGYSSNSIIIEHACASIANLSLYENNRVKLYDLNILTELVCIIKLYLNKSEIIEACCLAIIKIYSISIPNPIPGSHSHCISNRINNDHVIDNDVEVEVEVHKERLLTMGIERELVSVCTDSNISVEARTQSKNLLRTILEARTNFNMSSIHIECVDDIISLLNRVKLKPLWTGKLAEKILENIPILINENKSNQISLGYGNNVIVNILRILEYNIKSDNICMKVLIALSTLCRYNTEKSSSCMENIIAMGKYGTCEIVVKAVRKHLKSNQIARQGAWTIRNLALHDGNKVILGSSGVCELLVDALRLQVHMTTTSTAASTSTSIETILQICAAIANLCFDHPNKIKFGKFGVCELLISTLSRMIEVEVEEASSCNLDGVVEAACLAISKLMNENEFKSTFMRSSNTERMIINMSNNMKFALRTRLQCKKTLENFV